MSLIMGHNLISMIVWWMMTELFHDYIDQNIQMMKNIERKDGKVG